MYWIGLFDDCQCDENIEAWTEKTPNMKLYVFVRAFGVRKALLSAFCRLFGPTALRWNQEKLLRYWWWWTSGKFCTSCFCIETFLHPKISNKFNNPHHDFITQYFFGSIKSLKIHFFPLESHGSQAPPFGTWKFWNVDRKHEKHRTLCVPWAHGERNGKFDVLIVDVRSLLEYIWYIYCVGVIDLRVGSCSVVLVSQQRPGSILVWNWKYDLGVPSNTGPTKSQNHCHYNANGWKPREC